MGIRKCQQHTGPQNWGLGLHSKGPSSLDWRACPCHAEGFRSCWSIALSPTSSENILHEQMSLPTTMGTNPGHGSCRHPSRQRVERCCQHQLDQGQRGEPLGWSEHGIGVAGPGTNHIGAIAAGFRGPTGILRFAPDEVQISLSPGQGPRQMEMELQQRPVLHGDANCVPRCVS